MIASWLRAHLASERILVWVSAPRPSSTLEDFWAVVLDRIHAAGIALPDVDDLADPFTAVAKSLNALSRPVLLVLIRPDLISEPELDDQLIELLALCHNLDLVVTLSGFGMFAEPYLLDTDSRGHRRRVSCCSRQPIPPNCWNRRGCIRLRAMQNKSHP